MEQHPISEYPRLSRAIASYIREQAAHEGKEAVERCLESVFAHRGSLTELFEIPIRRGLLSFAGALEWLFFVMRIPFLHTEGPYFYEGDPAACLVDASVTLAVYFPGSDRRLARRHFEHALQN